MLAVRLPVTLPEFVELPMKLLAMYTPAAQP